MWFHRREMCRVGETHADTRVCTWFGVGSWQWLVQWVLGFLWGKKGTGGMTTSGITADGCKTLGTCGITEVCVCVWVGVSVYILGSFGIHGSHSTSASQVLELQAWVTMSDLQKWMLRYINYVSVCATKTFTSDVCSLRYINHMWQSCIHQGLERCYPVLSDTDCLLGAHWSLWVGMTISFFKKSGMFSAMLLKYETGSRSAAHADLELRAIRPQPLKVLGLPVWATTFGFRSHDLETFSAHFPLSSSGAPHWCSPTKRICYS